MKLPVIAVLIVGLSTLAYAQSLTDRWTAAFPGGSMTLDLAVAGTKVSGTMTVTQQGNSMSGPIADGTVSGTSLTFSVTVAGQTNAFVGELAGDEIRLRSTNNPAGMPLVFRRGGGPAPAGPPAVVSTPSGWRSTTRSAEIVDEAGRRVVRVEAKAGEGVVWMEGSALENGTIEVEMRGKDVVGQSFVGLAFRGLDDATYDAIYFRPFNFATTDADRKLRAVQYHSSPDFPWAKLRAEKPNQYEKPISPVPDPNGWFKVRVVLKVDAVAVYVNESATPTLSITALTKPRRGMVGLWVGNGSGGDFANLRLVPTP